MPCHFGCRPSDSLCRLLLPLLPLLLLLLLLLPLLLLLLLLLLLIDYWSQAVRSNPRGNLESYILAK